MLARHRVRLRPSLPEESCESVDELLPWNMFSSAASARGHHP